jgi:hypothetical protein
MITIDLVKGRNISVGDEQLKITNVKTIQAGNTEVRWSEYEITPSNMGRWLPPYAERSFSANMDIYISAVGKLPRSFYVSEMEL